MASIKVEILGDASNLQKSLEKATGASTSFGGALEKIGKAAAVATAAGVGALALGLEKSVKAAVDAQASTSRLDQAFANVGLSAKAASSQIDLAEASSRKLGFTDTDVRGALGSLITATGNVGTSMKDLSVAQDLARFKGIGLADASKMMTMAMTGSQRAAKQLGITVIPVTSAVDALKNAHINTASAAGQLELAHAKLIDKMSTGNAVIDAVSAKVRGQAQAYSDTAAGGMAQFHAQLDHLEVSLGTTMLPALANVSGGLATFVGKISDAQGASGKLRVVLQGLEGIAKEAGKEIESALSPQASIKGPFSENSGQAAAIKKSLTDQIESAVKGIDWSKFGKTLADGLVKGVTGSLKALPGLIIKYVKLDFSVWTGFAKAYAAAALQIGEAVVKGILKGIGDLGGKALHALESAIKSAVSSTAGFAGKEAGAIGHAIAAGVESGISGLAGGLAGKIKGEVDGALGAVKGVFGIHSPSTVTRDQIGIPLAEGIVLGAEGLGAKLSGEMIKQIQSALATTMSAAHQAAQSALSSFAQGNTTGDSAAVGMLNNELRDLKKAEADIQKLVQVTEGAQQAKYQAQLTLIQGRMAQIAKDKQIPEVIAELMQTFASDLKSLTAQNTGLLNAQTALSEEQAVGYFAATADAVLANHQLILGNLQSQSDVLTGEENKLKGKLAGADPQMKTALVAHINAIAGKITALSGDISSTMGTIEQDLANAVQTAQGQFQTAVGSLQSQLDAQLSAQILAATGYTADNSALQQMQQQDQQASLNDTLANATKQLATDMAAGSTATADQVAADHKAVDAANRAIVEYNLQIKVAGEYASAQDQIAKQTDTLNGKLGDLVGAVDSGSLSADGFSGALQGLGSQFGLTINDSVTPALAGAAGAAANLEGAFGSLIAWIHTQTGTGSASSPTPGYGGGPPAPGSDGSGGQIHVPGPQFALGGVVPGPIGAPLFATVHGGEVVIPVGGFKDSGSRAISRAVSPGGGGTIINLTVNGWVGRDQELAKRIHDQLVKRNWRNGG